MTDVNPYLSPVQFDSAPIKQLCVRRVGVLVLIHFAMNAWTIGSNWSELSWLHLLSGTAIWFILPLIALYLVSRNRPLGRWILAGLFGLRALGCLSILAMVVLPHGIPSRGLWGMRLIRNIIQGLAYGAATTWLLISPMIRQSKMPGESHA